jgi:hypothetical protein
VKEDWIRRLIEQSELEGEDRRLQEQNTTQRETQCHERIEGLWAGVVAELESAIQSFNEISPPDGRVSFRQERFDFTARKEKTRSPYNILCVRLDVETNQILSFQRSNSFYEVKIAAADLYVTRPNGSRIDKAGLAKELLSELFLTR